LTKAADGSISWRRVPIHPCHTAAVDDSHQVAAIDDEGPRAKSHKALRG
jgi:hypothetical protein